MIHRFSFSNFYSFRDEQTVDFTVGGKAPDTEAYVDSPFGTRVGKVLVAFGHNASGKTNLLRALDFLKWLITESFELQPDDSIVRVQPFLFSRKASAPSVFAAEFETGDRLFRYSVELTQCQILSERLDMADLPSKSFRYLFKRVWDEQEEIFHLRCNPEVPEFRLPDSYEAPVKRRNASLLSLGAAVSQPTSLAITKSWTNLETNVDYPFRRWAGHVSLIRRMNIGRFYYDNPHLRKRAMSLLEENDLGLDELRIATLSDESQGDGEIVCVPKGIHSVSGHDYEIPLQQESGGTVSLFVHLSRLLPVLDKGGIAVLDELDADLHPLVIPKLIDLFKSRQHNPHNAQLICTCHSAPLLNHLDKYQILLVEKDEEKNSHAWRLDETGARADDNYYAKYLAGAYGAVPNF